MKTTFKIENLCCPVCAGRMEKRIGKIKGIDSAEIDFLRGTLFIEAELITDALIEEIIKEAKKIARDCEIS